MRSNDGGIRITIRTHSHRSAPGLSRGAFDHRCGVGARSSDDDHGPPPAGRSRHRLGGGWAASFGECQEAARRPTQRISALRQRLTFWKRPRCRSGSRSRRWCKPVWNVRPAGRITVRISALHDRARTPGSCLQTTAAEPCQACRDLPTPVEALSSRLMLRCLCTVAAGGSPPRPRSAGSPSRRLGAVDVPRDPLDQVLRASPGVAAFSVAPSGQAQRACCRAAGSGDRRHHEVPMEPVALEAGRSRFERARQPGLQRASRQRRRRRETATSRLRRDAQIAAPSSGAHRAGLRVETITIRRHRPGSVVRVPKRSHSEARAKPWTRGRSTFTLAVERSRSGSCPIDGPCARQRASANRTGFRCPASRSNDSPARQKRSTLSSSGLRHRWEPTGILTSRSRAPPCRVVLRISTQVPSEADDAYFASASDRAFDQ